MAGSINKVILIGNLGKDPELLNFENGGSILKFPIATSENYLDKEGVKKEKTEWHNIVFRSSKMIEIGQKYLKKGDKIYVEGKIRSSQWVDNNNQNRYNFEIAADSITMLGSKSNNLKKSETQELKNNAKDDLPF
tara:strand:+ start:729 stop:1133 length:405 start_codon:yes stop_codon:yes gene_type:complete